MTMKNLRMLALCACFYGVSAGVAAQTNKLPLNEPDNNKPKLFQNYPEKVAVGTELFGSLFTTAVGKTTSAKSADGSPFLFDGELVSSVSKYENRIISLVIRPVNFPNAYFTVSKITDEQGNISYTGRIISKANGDVYVLKQENGFFSFIKKNYNDVVTE
jgi:hypothetical protein